MYSLDPLADVHSPLLNILDNSSSSPILFAALNNDASVMSLHPIAHGFTNQPQVTYAVISSQHGLSTVTSEYPAT